MASRTNRRQFLQTTAATGIGFWVAGGVQAKVSNRPTSGLPWPSIGVGGKGDRAILADAGNAGEMVAICDVDEKNLNAAGKPLAQGRRGIIDFRKMLEEMGKSIDAVTVSTPDHCHAAAALMAMRMGKHCFRAEAADAHDL